MPRMDIELTSTRESGDWTWRAAGARQPRGTVAADLVPTEATPGDVLRVEFEQYMDGIEVTSVLPPKTTRQGAEVLEVLGSGLDEPLVTTKLVGRKGRRREDGSSDRRGGRPNDRIKDGGRGGRRTTNGQSKKRSKNDHRPNSERDRRSGANNKRASRTRGHSAEEAPRTPRLKPRRIHRKAALADLPDDQRLLGQILLRDGVPGVRKAIESQNAAAELAGEPPIPAPLLLKLAERLHPRLRAADWQDRAEAALAGIEDIDLRDLRSVVVAAEQAARGEENKALAEQIRVGLTARVDREHATWLVDVSNALDEDRVVRALRLSSRPPKAGAPLPAPLLDRLSTSAAAALNAETGSDRWATVLDAVALSPVHLRVTPQGLPPRPSEALLEVVKRVSMSVPTIAQAFGIDPAPPPRNRGGRRRR